MQRRNSASKSIQAKAMVVNHRLRANSRMEELMRSKGVEVARLTAQLRKAEMMVSSLERQVDQKVSFGILAL